VISKQTRVAFREHLVGWTLRTITDLFDAADVARGSPAGLTSGARRSLVEEYYAGVNWSTTADTQGAGRVEDAHHGAKVRASLARAPAAGDRAAGDQTGCGEAGRSRNGEVVP